MDNHTISPKSIMRACHHPRYAPPHGRRFGESGELRRCPKCLRWWKRDDIIPSFWVPVRFFNLKALSRIKKFEKTGSHMLTIIGSDKTVED